MRVLIAVDADVRERVLDWARTFPDLFKEPPQLTLLHVVPIPLEGISGVQDQTYDLDLEHFRTAVRERYPDLAERVQWMVRAGKPGAEICEAAVGFDLLVLGANERSQVSQLLLGSTSAYVVHNAPCAVLLLRPGAQTPAR